MHRSQLASALCYIKQIAKTAEQFEFDRGILYATLIIVPLATLCAFYISTRMKRRSRDGKCPRECKEPRRAPDNPLTCVPNQSEVKYEIVVGFIVD